MMDDLNFKLRGSQPGWEKDHGNKTNEELDTPQIGMVFDLLVKTHPDLERFALTNTGHIVWARRKGGGPRPMAAERRVGWTRQDFDAAKL
jgi:hypothetical protein